MLILQEAFDKVDNGTYPSIYEFAPDIDQLERLLTANEVNLGFI